VKGIPKGGYFLKIKKDPKAFRQDGVPEMHFEPK